MSQSEKSFTVSDRRHFTPEGRPREDAPETEKADAAPETQQRTSENQDRHGAGPDRPVDFGQFVLSLASEAGRLMAGEGAPEGAPPAETLAAARQIVGILEMLKDKTEGRRTSEEDALLSELLFQLRMAYVERTRAGKP
jgi:hypothetical protein